MGLCSGQPSRLQRIHPHRVAMVTRGTVVFPEAYDSQRTKGKHVQMTDTCQGSPSRVACWTRIDTVGASPSAGGKAVPTLRPWVQG